MLAPDSGLRWTSSSKAKAVRWKHLRLTFMGNEKKETTRASKTFKCHFSQTPQSLWGRERDWAFFSFSNCIQRPRQRETRVLGDLPDTSIFQETKTTLMARTGQVTRAGYGEGVV